MKHSFTVLFLLCVTVYMAKAMECNEPFVPAELTVCDLAEIDTLVHQLNDHIKQAEILSQVIKNNIPLIENPATRYAFKRYFEYWSWKLAKRQTGLCTVESALSEFIDKFQVEPREKNKNEQVISKGIFVTALVDHFIKNLQCALASLTTVRHEIIEIKKQADREERTPWHVSLWSRKLANNLDLASQLLLAVNELKQVTAQIKTPPPQQLKAKECWF